MNGQVAFCSTNVLTSLLLSATSLSESAPIEILPFLARKHRARHPTSPPGRPRSTSSIYGVGAHYDRHLDTLRGPKNRLLSTVVYLHDEWSLADGGELLLYGAGGAIVRILPKPGLMVLFLSEEFPHEVLAASKPRHSIAGWFRGRVPATLPAG